MLTKEQLAVLYLVGRHTEGDTHAPAPAQAPCEEETLPASPSTREGKEDKEEQPPGMGAVLWTDEHRIYVRALSAAF